MTTGRKGVFETPIGTIEFTHTQKSIAKILDSTLVIGRPLKWFFFLGQFCGLAKMHLISAHAVFRVCCSAKYAVSGVR